MMKWRVWEGRWEGMCRRSEGREGDGVRIMLFGVSERVREGQEQREDRAVRVGQLSDQIVQLCRQLKLYLS